MVVEVTHRSWFRRLWDSLVGVLFGFLLLAGATFLLFWNEGRFVHRQQDLEEGATQAREIPSARVDPQHDGRLVVVSGQAHTDEQLTDPEFGVQAVALKLRRLVEMYQWDEEVETRRKRKIGGGETEERVYTYRKDWFDHLQDSSGFKETGHDNPNRMPFPQFSQMAQQVTLGAFHLTPDLTARITHETALPATPEMAAALPAELPLKFRAVDGALYAGQDPQQPQIGDTRIRFFTVSPQPVTLLAQQQGDTFTAYRTRGGRELLELRGGTLSKAQFFENLATENTVLVWVLRAVGAGLIFVGLLLVSRPLSVLAGVIPLFEDVLGMGFGFFALFGALTWSLCVIAVGWLTYRPLYGIGLLIAAGLLVYWMRRSGRRKIARSTPPLPGGAPPLPPPLPRG